MRVEFENRHDVRRVIGECETEEEAFKIIYDFLKEHNYESYYTRVNYLSDNHLWVDVGSHVEFFHIYKQESYMAKLFLRFVFGVFTGVGSIYLFTVLLVKKLEDME